MLYMICQHGTLSFIIVLYKITAKDIITYIFFKISYYIPLKLCQVYSN